MSWGVEDDLPGRRLSDQELADLQDSWSFDKVVAEHADGEVDQLRCRVGLMEYVLAFSGERWEKDDVRMRDDL